MVKDHKMGHRKRLLSFGFSIPKDGSDMFRNIINKLPLLAA